MFTLVDNTYTQEDTVGTHHLQENEMSSIQMDDDLYTVYSKLINAPNRHELLLAAYEQLHAYNKSPKYYVLPNLYGWMRPAIEIYGNDPEGYLDFVRSVVDHFPKRSDERANLKPPLRKAESWVDQLIRRRRVALAQDAYEKAHGPFADNDEKKLYGLRIFALWKLQRQNILAKLVRTSESGRSSAEDRRDACTAHWEKIEKELAQGTVPNIAELDQQIEAAAQLNERITGKPPKKTW